MSSTLVLLTAVGFDLLADEPPTHALAVGLVALIVGIGRLRLSGRFRGAFAAANLAVVGQPAVHALSKLTQAGADWLPHSHGWPESVSAIALHVAVALLVVGVAASEPACCYVASTVALVVGHVLRRPVAPATTELATTGHRDEPRAREHQLLFAKQAHRRGPPIGFTLAL
ncbi:hypothetical protein [Actinomycetospora lemnae]|uniref:MFS transporter n=1 Tax=Actinomycetospora lemnae TaxID=3019891 RepID=A0ABT5STZ2_9PSEU|nr:hypothetical protein [Actinomycetospora sp. DW7H6]MDD7966156.1 hypothetical protein [Actinomycetospora sp. DW7H6]